MKLGLVVKPLKRGKRVDEKQKALIKKLVKEITDEAKKVVEDYTNSPSEMSGSTTQVHEDSPLLK